MPEGTVKVTFNVLTSEFEALKAQATREGSSVTRILRRAIGTELFLKENEANGAKLLIEERDGTLSQVVRGWSELPPDKSASTALRKSRYKRDPVI